jgi:hypothetical protein
MELRGIDAVVHEFRPTVPTRMIGGNEDGSRRKPLTRFAIAMDGCDQSDPDPRLVL